MKLVEKKFVVDEKGERVGVILTIEDYRKTLEQLEELESIVAYDEAKASGEEAVPFEKAIEKIGKYPF